METFVYFEAYSFREIVSMLILRRISTMLYKQILLGSGTACGSFPVCGSSVEVSSISVIPPVKKYLSSRCALHCHSMIFWLSPVVYMYFILMLHNFKSNWLPYIQNKHSIIIAYKQMNYILTFLLSRHRHKLS